MLEKSDKCVGKRMRGRIVLDKKRIISNVWQLLGLGPLSPVPAAVVTSKLYDTTKLLLHHYANQSHHCFTFKNKRQGSLSCKNLGRVKCILTLFHFSECQHFSELAKTF